MGKSSQTKGAAGERELAAILRQYGYDIQRGGFVFGEVPDLVGLPGIHIEVKRVEKLNLDAAMEQSIRDSEKFRDGFPTVFHRKNRSKWQVTMRVGDLVEIYLNSDFPNKQEKRFQQIGEKYVTMLLDDWLEIYNNSDYPDNREVGEDAQEAVHIL